MADEMEYAVRRVSDGRYLWDDDLDGVYQSWQKDPENASWLDTEAEALNLAVLATWPKRTMRSNSRTATKSPPAQSHGRMTCNRIRTIRTPNGDPIGRKAPARI